MVSVYDLKPRFQALLRPLARFCAANGVTANGVTLAAMAGSLLLGGALLAFSRTPALFLLLPMWMILRMALNALDGLLAREFGQQSAAGAYLNELCDVVSDAALYLPFAVVAPFGPASVGALIFLSALSEMAGALGAAFGGGRRYDGPLGKSDRALVFGALGLWLGLAHSLPDWMFWIAPAMAAALMLNIVNRVRSGLSPHQ